MSVLAILFASFFLFSPSEQVSAAPPAEKYRFNDVKSIVGFEGDYLDPVVFERSTLVGDSEFNPGSTYTTNARPRLTTGCYLVLLKIDSFNADGTEGILKEQPVTSQPTNIKFCDPKVQQSFLNKSIRLDNSAIRKIVDKNINVTVKLKTNATKPEQIPDDYRTDEVTIEGPSGPNSVKLAGQPTAFIEGEYITFRLPSTNHEPGTYKACSKLAKKCIDFPKETTKTADVLIQSEELVEGKRTGGGLSGDACQTTLDCANPLNCVSNKCSTKDPDDYKPPTPPPAPCPPGKFKDGVCTEFNTALGLFSTNPGGFIASVFAILLAASGAIALLLIMRAGYKIMTSQGKPEAIQEGRDQLIAAVVGLLFLIFSLVFLQVIGVDILKIPGLDGPNSDKAPPQNINIEVSCDPNNDQCADGFTCESEGPGRGGFCKKN